MAGYATNTRSGLWRSCGEIMERPEALEVSSAFLDLFGISHIVVTGFSAKQMTHSNRQVIEITALSDTEYVIESNDY